MSKNKIYLFIFSKSVFNIKTIDILQNNNVKKKLIENKLKKNFKF